MTLGDLTAGKVYCDVNIFYLFLRRDPAHHTIVRTFFKRMVSGAIEVYSSVLAMDELFYRLLLAR
jgi:predicted nucleic acid-binding protein